MENESNNLNENLIQNNENENNNAIPNLNSNNENENEFRNLNNNQQQQRQRSFGERLTSKDILEFSNDFFPSVVIISILAYCLNYSQQKPCDSNYFNFFKNMTYIYFIFTFRGLLRALLVYTNSISKIWAKFGFNVSDLVIYM